jgi:MEDS: MEthanogen/methylotroph, DcmR Sensory domain
MTEPASGYGHDALCYASDEDMIASAVPFLRAALDADFGADRASWAEWARFEAIINTVLARYPLWNVCMYNARQLPSEVLAAAELTHPHLLTAAARIPNPHFLDPALLLRQLPRTGRDPLEATPPGIDRPDPSDLLKLRQDVRDLLAASGHPTETVSGFVFAVSEVASNALTHGPPPARDIRR